MAYSFVCKNCGHREAAHIHPELLDEEEQMTHVRGYRLSIQTCEGFEYSRKDYKKLIAEYRADPSESISLPEEVAERIAELDEADGTAEHVREALERQARGRAAFGQYITHCYHQKIATDLAKLDKEISHAPTNAKRDVVLQARGKYLSDAHKSGSLYIG